jgi:putative hydrolase of the HAD superfamily
MIKAVFWDFGGVITSSPFESFNRFEKENDLPKDFLRSVNSTNPDFNAWAKLERNEVNLEQFDELFEIESKNLGNAVKGKDVVALLRGQIRPEMIVTLKKIKGNLIQACLTNNIQSMGDMDFEGNVSASGKHEEVMELFDFVFESSKENVRKPDPEFYIRACERGNVNPDEVVFLDDLGINLKPAKALGMKTIKVVKPQEALLELNSYLEIDLN